MITTAITLASIMGITQNVCSEECVAIVVVTDTLMADGIFTLHFILPHKPIPKETQDFLD